MKVFASKIPLLLPARIPLDEELPLKTKNLTAIVAQSVQIALRLRFYLLQLKSRSATLQKPCRRNDAPGRHLPLNAAAELNRSRAATSGDLAERGRGRTGIPDVEERMIQEAQRHHSESHPQPFSDADILVDTHVQNVQVVVA